MSRKSNKLPKETTQLGHSATVLNYGPTSFNTKKWKQRPSLKSLHLLYSYSESILCFCSPLSARYLWGSFLGFPPKSFRFFPYASTEHKPKNLVDLIMLLKETTKCSHFGFCFDCMKIPTAYLSNRLFTNLPLNTTKWLSICPPNHLG